MRIRTPLDLGQTIRERRRALDMDQKTLGEKVGVSRQWVIDLEKGRPGAGIGLVLRAMRVLDLSLDVVRPDETAAMADPGFPDVDLNAVIERARGKR